MLLYSNHGTEHSTATEAGTTLHTPQKAYIQTHKVAPLSDSHRFLKGVLQTARKGTAHPRGSPWYAPLAPDFSACIPKLQLRVISTLSASVQSQATCVHSITCTIQVGTRVCRMWFRCFPVPQASHLSWPASVLVCVITVADGCASFHSTAALEPSTPGPTTSRS